MPRGKIRFTPESDEFGFISFNVIEFKPEIAALILNESAQGACLVINRKQIPPKVKIQDGLLIQVKIGKLEPLDSIIRWVSEVDEDLIKIGLEHQE